MNMTETLHFRFLNMRRPRGGFYDMPPMMSRLPIKTASGAFSTLPRYNRSNTIGPCGYR